MSANIFTQSGKKETFVLKLLTGNIMRLIRKHVKLPRHQEVLFLN